MIVEISTELLLETIRPGNQIHAEVLRGPGGAYTLETARMNERGNLELGFRHKNDESVNPARDTLLFRRLGS